VLRARPATVRENWFARLYLMKGLIIVAVVLFWCASALIALTVAYPAAVAILTAHGYSLGPAQTMTIAGSMMDFSIGLAIAFRQTNRWDLMAGIALSLLPS
jgi:DoxX-like family